MQMRLNAVQVVRQQRKRRLKLSSVEFGAGGGLASQMIIIADNNMTKDMIDVH